MLTSIPAYYAGMIVILKIQGIPSFSRKGMLDRRGKVAYRVDERPVQVEYYK